MCKGSALSTVSSLQSQIHNMLKGIYISFFLIFPDILIFNTWHIFLEIWGLIVPAMKKSFLYTELLIWEVIRIKANRDSVEARKVLCRKSNVKGKKLTYFTFGKRQPFCTDNSKVTFRNESSTFVSALKLYLAIASPISPGWAGGGGLAGCAFSGGKSFCVRKQLFRQDG